MVKKYNKWDEDRKQLFIKMYQSEDLDKIAREFDVSRSSLATIASTFGAQRRACRNANYTKEEDEIIISYASKGKRAKDIAEILPWRTISSINTRIQRLGLTKNIRWTKQEDQLLKELYPIRRIDDIADLFPNRSRDAIILHAGKLGLKAYMEYHDYQESDYEFIKNHFEDMSDEDIGTVLGRSKESIKNHRNKMRLYRHTPGNVNYESTVKFLRANNTGWKKSSIKKCGYKCVITGKRFDDIHHLYSFNSILQDVYSRLKLDKELFDVNKLSEDDRWDFASEFYQEQSLHGTGLCLAKEIHEDFHKIYGFGENTKEQFVTYVAEKYPELSESVNSIIMCS